MAYADPHSPQAIANQQKYNRSAKGKARTRRWQGSERGKAYYVQARKRMRAKHHDKARARDAFGAEVRAGRIKRRARCQVCRRAGRIEAHHYKGYTKEHWYTVLWLCKPCHVLAEG